MAQLPPEQRDLAQAQLAVLAAQPSWLPLVAVWERLAAITLQVALSVVVVQVFRRGRLAWLWLAIAAHAAVDLLAVGMVQVLGRETTGLVATETVLTLVALGASWAILRLRDESAHPAASPSTAAPVTDRS